jgi:hypothetical protein
MKNHSIKAARLIVLVFIGLLIVSALSRNKRISSAQSSPCPTESSPTFAPNDNVYVDINPEFDPTQTSQITTALNRWTYANTHNNTSGVIFPQGY